MSKNARKIAELLGAKAVALVPKTGGGAFGTARLAAIVGELQGRLAPGRGKRPGRPTDASWVRHPKVPMSEATQRRLAQLAQHMSGEGRKVSPMQLAAQILEDAVARMPDE
jgi:hypothetical protein